MNSAIIFIAIAGSVQISVKTKEDKTIYMLDNRETAVYVTLASWVCAYNFSEEAVLLGLPRTSSYGMAEFMINKAAKEENDSHLRFVF